MRRRSAIGAMWLLLAALGLSPALSLAQAPSNAPSGLAARLPATIEGGAVEVVYAEDLQTWVDTLFPGETHPEIDALGAALAGQGLSLADVATVTAYFGPDQGGQIQGFGIPGGDAASLQDAVAAVYLMGLAEFERTERVIGDRAVTFLSEGPLDAEAYPFAVMPDTDVLWILDAEVADIVDALEALLAVSAGTAPGNTGTAPTPKPPIGPEEWTGSMQGTVTWDKGAYHGTATATFTGSWILPELSTTDFCGSDCVAYIPAGTIDWRWESTAPGPPSCSVDISGSVPAGDTILSQDQMLFMQRVGTDHLGYWGFGTVFLPPQDCVGWESSRAPSSFLEIPDPNPDEPFADEVPTLRPGCSRMQWRIELDATELKGTCWRYDQPGYEERFDWDLRRVPEP